LRLSWWRLVAGALAAPVLLAAGVSVAAGGSWLAALVPSSASVERAPRVSSVSMASAGVLRVRFSERVRAGGRFGWRVRAGMLSGSR
jgi:hypothetical protein